MNWGVTAHDDRRAMHLDKSTPNPLKIRTADEGDLLGLATLYKQLNSDDETPSPSDGARILEQFQLYPGSVIFVGSLELELVTTCALIVVPNLTRGGRPYALIENVVTDKTHRKCGYGKAVLREAIASAWQHRCYKVMLLTGSSDPGTLKFYDDVGFEQSKVGFQIRRIPARES